MEFEAEPLAFGERLPQQVDGFRTVAEDRGDARA